MGEEKREGIWVVFDFIRYFEIRTIAVVWKNCR